MFVYQKNKKLCITSKNKPVENPGLVIEESKDKDIIVTFNGQSADGGNSTEVQSAIKNGGIGWTEKGEKDQPTEEISISGDITDKEPDLGLSAYYGDNIYKISDEVFTAEQLIGCKVITKGISKDGLNEVITTIEEVSTYDQDQTFEAVIYYGRFAVISEEISDTVTIDEQDIDVTIAPGTYYAPWDDSSYNWAIEKIIVSEEIKEQPEISFEWTQEQQTEDAEGIQDWYKLPDELVPANITAEDFLGKTMTIISDEVDNVFLNTITEDPSVPIISIGFIQDNNYQPCLAVVKEEFVNDDSGETMTPGLWFLKLYAEEFTAKCVLQEEIVFEEPEIVHKIDSKFIDDGVGGQFFIRAKEDGEYYRLDKTWKEISDAYDNDMDIHISVKTTKNVTLNSVAVTKPFHNVGEFNEYGVSAKFVLENNSGVWAPFTGFSTFDDENGYPYCMKSSFDDYID